MTKQVARKRQLYSRRALPQWNSTLITGWSLLRNDLKGSHVCALDSAGSQGCLRQVGLPVNPGHPEGVCDHRAGVRDAFDVAWSDATARCDNSHTASRLASLTPARRYRKMHSQQSCAVPP